VHSQPAGSGDPLFSGLGTLDPERARTAVKERLGSDPQKLLTEHKAALEALQFLLNRPNPAADIGVSLEGKSVELTGPFAIGSTFSENLLLEYTNGMQGKSLGWGRLTKENLHQVLELHAVYADLMRRTPYLARVRGSNLLAQVLHSLEQAETGRETAGALGRPGDAVLLISGHDTNLSNLSGMLGLSWSLPGYQADDTPPGGALIFSLWHDAEAGRDFVKLRYTAQTLDQMRNGEPLSLESPPAGQEVTLPGCPAVATGGCPWEAARAVLQKAIDPTAAGVR
jgi:4-phytase/acid phosphatase